MPHIAGIALLPPHDAVSTRRLPRNAPAQLEQARPLADALAAATILAL
jgi:hypothetical protein